MLIRLMSDLHIEFDRQGLSCEYTPPTLDTDKETVLILAGDIDVQGRGIDYANKMSERFKSVVLVAGNHDFYGETLAGVKNKWVKGASGNVHPLFNSSIIIDDVLFVGGTLWTDYDGENPRSIMSAKDTMSDYSSIKGNSLKGYIAPETLLADHKMCLKALCRTLGTPVSKRVAVTHMAPSYSLRDTQYREDIVEAYFYSNLDYLIPEFDLWCYGHTHYNCDKVLGDTRVVSNQRGYYGYKLENDFKDTLVIEI